MKHLLKKIAASRSKIVAHIKFGNDTFNLLSREGMTVGTFNGCDVLSYSANQNMSERVSRLVEDFLGCCLKESKSPSIAVFRDKSACDFDMLFEQLKAIPGAKKVIIKVIPEDCPEIEKSIRPDFDVSNVIDPKVLVESLKGFISTITEINNVLNVCREDALTLTNGRLVNTMWGAKSMQSMLEGMHEDVAQNEKWERAEFFANLVIKSSDRLCHKLSTELAKVCSEEKKMIGTVLIPNILSNYEQFKEIAQSALVALSSVIYIDVIFKKMTSYPATWFLSSGMLEDLKQDYQKLLKFFMQVPRIEREIIYPLDFMRLQYSIA